MPNQRIAATPRGGEQRGWLLPVRVAIQPAQSELHSRAPSRWPTGSSPSAAADMQRSCAAPMQVHRVEEGELIVVVNSAHLDHGVVDRLAADDFSEQTFESLGCRSGPDGKRERDDVSGKDSAV